MQPEVRLLGALRVTADGVAWEPAADRRSAVLAYLAYAGTWVPRDDLLYLFWPDSDEHKGRANLRQLLVALRARPFAAGLEVERTRIRWRARTDAAAWADALERGDLSGARGGWPRPLLDGFRLPSAPEFESWLELERSAWQERLRRALLAAANRGPDGGADGELAQLLERWLTVAPLDEEVLRTWLAACARSGRRTAALAGFMAFEARLAAEMGVAPERATVAMADALRAEATAPAPVPSARPETRGTQAGRRLSASPFFGRQPELARLEAELLREDAPIVTLLAAGGLGKTRLAVEAAARLGPRFPDGAAVVWLAGARALNEIAPALLDAMGLDLEPLGAPLEQAAAALAGRRMLVVLDNLEQLPGADAIVGRLRDAAPGVAWLLTSRVRLGLGAETLVELDGLPVPGGDDGDLAGYGAVDLLLARAHRVGHPIDLPRQSEAVVRVCRATAGMPLALELAAGWLRVLPIEGIADELERGIEVLAATDADVDPRHVSMRVAFDASWRALSSAERRALARLSVFRGGFTEVAAREAADVRRPLLLALRNKSFVSLAGDGRFFQHPLLATYLRERAAEDADAHEVARDAHARWFLAYLGRAEDDGQFGQRRAAVQALAAEHGNLEVAWARALERGWWRPLEKGGAFLGLSYLYVGRPERWGELLRAALARVPPGSITWAVLEVHESAIDEYAGRHQEAYARRRRAVETLRRHEDGFSLAWGLVLLAESAVSLGFGDEARACLTESVHLWESVGAASLVGLALRSLHPIVDDPDERERLFERVLANRRVTANDEAQVRAALDHGVFLAHTYGAYAEALGLIDWAVAHEREVDWVRTYVAMFLAEAAEVRLVAGDLDGAEAQIGEALDIWLAGRPLHLGVEPDMRALAATIAWRRGDAVAARAHMPPASEAAACLRGLLLASEMARADDPVAARAYAQRALVRVAPPLAGRDGQLRRVRALTVAAEAALAAGDVASACREFLEVLDLVTGWRFLPALLEACAAAAPLLASPLADEVHAWAVRHPAAAYVTRCRMAPEASSAPVPPTALDVPADRDAAWAQALEMARRVLEGLGG